MSQRNTGVYQQNPSSYVLNSNPTDDNIRRSKGQSKQPGQPQYAHNTGALSLLLPSLASILWWHDSIVVLQIFLFVALGLYALDLINSRDGVAVGVWIGALSMTIASAYGTLLQADDLNASGMSTINFLLQLAVEGMSFCTWACWITLQFQWLHSDLPSLASGMELTLHSLAPPVSSAILTYHLQRLVLDYWGMDLVATLTPLVFAAFMMIGMIVVGCSTSSKTKKQSTNDDSDFILTSLSARMHTMILLLVPGTMHVLTFRDRIFSRYASFDEIYDLALVWTIPYLFQCVILGLFEKSPYSLPKILFPKAGDTTIRSSLAPSAATLVACIAAQQRYLIPLCNQVSYQFNGHNLASTWVVSLYLTIATSAALFSMIVWGRTSSVTNEPLFGEYHEDVVQLSVSLSGMLLGKAFGFPWNLTPLPILAFLGLSVWITTRMMRYLAIFLFVIHASGVVVFGYRFASINVKIPLALRGIEVALTRFGMAEVCSSILIGLIVGFVARPEGGYGASFIKRVDVPGVVLVAYCLLLAVLEVTLLRQELPESIPSREVVSDVEDSDVVYDHVTALVTSCLIITIAVLTRRIKVISKVTYRAAIAVALGKAIAIFIDASESDSKIRSGRSEQHLTQQLLYRVVVTTVLIFVIQAPSALLAPIYVKGGSRGRRKASNDKIPAVAIRNISLYSLLILPLALLACVPSVLSPLVKALSVHYNLGSYYNMALPVSETLGCALALWGVSTLYMLNNYFPDGGCELWKKSSALTLLMGVAIAFSAPTVPEWLMGENDLGISNSYARISSVGSRLATQGHNRTGGWGILSASLATLLAITGPFELRDRRHPSGRKDKSLFLRIMMFSIMFGCGISWFITILSMSQENSAALAITTLSCMVLSFFGTIACVVAYHVELDSFHEVMEMVAVCGGVFILFLIVTLVASLLITRDLGALFSHAGCVSTYLTIACCITLSFALALRSRSSKTQTSISMSNLSCIIGYVLAIITILGRFGVAGLDSELEVMVIMGMPASLFGIICVAPILLLLEGEGAAETRSRAPRTMGTGRSTDMLGLSLKNLNGSNKFVPPLAATVISFYVVGLYTIFGRGAPLINLFLATSHFRFAAGKADSLTAILKAFRKSKDKKDILALLAEKATENSRAYSISSHLEESGFWTATSMSGPLLHTFGLLATIPSAYLLLSQSWYGVPAPRAQMLFALPLNIIPILACAGTPTIRALGVTLVLVGMVQSMRKGNRSQMRL